MKNNQVKILAVALYEASKDKKDKELDTVISNFSAYLNQHYLVSMIPSILAELENIHFLNEDIVAVKVTSPEELDTSEIKKISDLVKDKVNGEARQGESQSERGSSGGEGGLGHKTKQEVVVKTETDKDLVGGAVIKYNDKIIDMSIRHQLNNLAKQLSN